MGSKEVEILSSIKEAEDYSDELLIKAQSEKDAIIKNAQKEASELLARNAEEVKKAQEKKVNDFRARSDSIKKEKLDEAKRHAKQLESKGEKNIGKAADFIIAKTEESI